MKNKISIIDYNIGNIGSVIKAFKYLDAEIEIVNTPEQIQNSNKLVLPGVSAFGSAMKKLNNLNLVESIKNYINSGNWFLGICVGLQLLFEKSEETPGVSGLNIFKGEVKKFNNPDLIVPHMGWNTINFKKENVLFNKIKNKSFFYFVHSYYVVPENTDIILTETEYDIKFCSSVSYKNVIATQFHPEKSQDNGLQILKNFISL